MVVRICPDNFSLNSTLIGEMCPELKNPLPELCAYFVKQCEVNLSRLRKTYLSEFMKHRPGRYELLISEASADWLIPFRRKDGADFRE